MNGEQSEESYEEDPFKQVYLEKVDMKSILFYQFQTMNNIGSYHHDTKQWVDAVETFCRALRGTKKTKQKDTFMGELNKINTDFTNEVKKEQMDKIAILKLQIKYADKKADAAMDFFSESGLAGQVGIAERRRR